MRKESDRLFDFGNFFEEQPRFDFLNLVQIAEVALVPGGRIEDHVQICHEISYIVSGSGVFHTNGESYPVAPGDIHVVAKGDMHGIDVSKTEKLRYICIGFTFSDVPIEYRHVVDFFLSSPSATASCGGDLRSLFDMLIGEFYVLQEDRAVAIAELLKLILIKVRRAFVFDEKKRQKPERGIGEPSTVYRIVKYVDDHIYDIRTVGEIARELHYSESYISTLFRRKMGVTLQTYIREKKLETAKMLLAFGNLTVGEVAALMHFDCASGFSRIFKRRYGITPHAYVSRKGKENHDT